MRIFAAIVAVILGASVALAQGDAKTPYGPMSAVKNAKSTAKPKTARKESKATTKPTTRSKRKAARKSEPEAAKPKPEAAEAKAKSDKSAKPDQPTTTGSAATGTPAATTDLRQSYAAIPLAERIALQSDLIWTGDYNGLIDGEFSDRLVEAVKAYQKRHKDKVTGVPSAPARAALTAAARPTQEEVGWHLAEDPVTGARVGLPGKLATRTAPGAAGTRWSSAQGQLQIETFQIDTGATLEAVFEQQKKLAKRRVTTNALRPDYFVVSGTQGLKKFYVRAFTKDGEVRGLTILYDQAMAGTMDPIVAAISSAFVPFASYTVASAGTTEVSRRKVEYGSGLVVSPTGHIVAARHAVERCQVIAIPTLGNAERVAEDKDSELALLRVYGMHDLVPIGLPGGAAGGDQVTLVGIADPQAQGGGAAVTAVPARLTRGANAPALDPAPALGFSGAAALDREERLLGIAIHKSSVVAGLSGPPQAALAPLAKLRNFLQVNGVAPAAGRTGIEGAKAATVRVICVRK
jgi:peptidoglycan hydrolase-like protein with peptidoglycan-binding domain